MFQENKQKCIWSGKKTTDVKPVTLETLDRFTIPTEKTFYVLPEFESKLREFNDRFITYGRTFLYLIIGLTILLVVVPLLVLALSVSEKFLLLVTGFITSLMGIVVVIFPFTTPETIHWLGIRKAQKIGRFVGFLTLILGIVIIFLPNH
ncbi:hypothetical protein [Gracilimonas halophila]|uniref:Uncharacterized protein n=1 Tax=Gracilimonas halophila TaxID=1834464 RepID=A0ABW5JH87_9BACT